MPETKTETASLLRLPAYVCYSKITRFSRLQRKKIISTVKNVAALFTQAYFEENETSFFFSKH